MGPLTTRLKAQSLLVFEGHSWVAVFLVCTQLDIMLRAVPGGGEGVLIERSGILAGMKHRIWAWSYGSRAMGFAGHPAPVVLLDKW